MKHLSIITCILLLFSFRVKAQDASANTAYAGGKAVFVYHAFHPASPRYPDKGFTGYQLERQDISVPGKWTVVGSFHTPQNAGELYENFQQSLRFFPDGKSLKFDAESAWTKFIKDGQELDSLKIELAFTPIQMAFGILIADTTVVKGKTYQYRVSQAGADNGASFTTNRVAFPAILKALKPRLLQRKVESKAIRIEWFARGDFNSFNFRVFRSTGNDKVYSEIKPYLFMEVKGDTLKYSIRDEHVAFSTMYHYFITPVNSFGGGGNIVSDTVNATCMEARGLLTPQYFSAKGDSIAHAIKIKFQLANPAFISAVSVMRSISYDSGFEEIGVASPADSTFLDFRIEDGQKYYYYLLMIDKMGRKTNRSAKTFGLYQTTKNDFPASYVRAVKQGKNVLVSWTNPRGEKLSGYYVYRSEGVGQTMKRLTALIPQHDSTGNYIDQYPFRPGITYGYSVRSENKSNVESKNSKIVYIMPRPVDSSLFAPKKVQASVQNQLIILTWDNIRQLNPTQRGYRIWRKAESDKNDMVIMDNYPAAFSSYSDSTAKPGISYVYGVESTSGGISSVKTTSNTVAVRALPYTHPEGLIALVAKNGISLTWGKVIDSRIKQFAIYRYQKGGQPKWIATVDGNKNAYLDTKAVKGGLYYFFVRSLGDNPAQASGDSNEAFVSY